ncbi:MAG: hypothetical protein Q4E67_04760 [Planctomycetia bacterium]|nr:hypothetical protein [Planctomycetia bacterium]MDO5113666.1 hypothetical protein [Planctomycetia bacterium]
MCFSCRWGCLFLVLVALTVGCGSREDGPPVAQVSGKVTYQGKPVSSGTIWFTPKDTGLLPARGILRSNGTYQLEIAEKGIRGAYVGEYGIWVDTRIVSEDGPPQPSLLPKKYESPETSGLTATIESRKKNQFDFSLE